MAANSPPGRSSRQQGARRLTPQHRSIDRLPVTPAYASKPPMTGIALITLSRGRCPKRRSLLHALQQRRRPTRDAQRAQQFRQPAEPIGVPVRCVDHVDRAHFLGRQLPCLPADVCRSDDLVQLRGDRLRGDLAAHFPCCVIRKAIVKPSIDAR